MDKANRLLPGGYYWKQTTWVGESEWGELCTPYHKKLCDMRLKDFEIFAAHMTPRAGHSQAQSGVDNVVTKWHEYCEAMGGTPDGDDYLHTLIQTTLDSVLDEANAVIAELVEALEAAIAYIGGNSVVGNQFLDLLEATQSRARAYIGKAGG